MKHSKKKLRQRYRQIRSEVAKSQRIKESVAVCEHLFCTEAYQSAEVILSYLSYGSELRTETLLEQAFRDQKILAAPRINGNEMVFLQMDSDTVFEKNSYGILEPVSGQEILPETYGKVLLVLPGLCFDRKNGRIGYGGGFYDRYVSAHRTKSNIKIVALALSCQYFDGTIPMEAHDIRPDFVVFPYGIQAE